MNILSINITFLFYLGYVLSEIDFLNVNDYYELLGISKEASKKEIRKAFKSWALIYHPDKSDNPKAHEIFLKINKAYTVLIDDSKRDIYDRLGESGLEKSEKDGNQQQWQWYESFTFYHQNFGLYDDDPNILTLTHQDFIKYVGPLIGANREATHNIPGYTEIWFVDFYSAQCSHCRDLAPDWKRLAGDLLGIVKIGAVNCLEEWNLCMSQHLTSYPTLILFPSGERFEGTMSYTTLKKWLLTRIPSHHLKFNGMIPAKDSKDTNDKPLLLDQIVTDNRNLYFTIQTSFKNDETNIMTSTYLYNHFSMTSDTFPWLIYFCPSATNDAENQHHACPSNIEIRRLSKQLYGYVNVINYKCATINNDNTTHTNHVLCNEKYLTKGTSFSLWYMPGGLVTTLYNEKQDIEINLTDGLGINILSVDGKYEFIPFTMLNDLSKFSNFVVNVIFQSHLPPIIPTLTFSDLIKLFHGYSEPYNVAALNTKLEFNKDMLINYPTLVILLLTPMNYESDVFERFNLTLYRFKATLDEKVSNIPSLKIFYFKCYETEYISKYCRETLGIHGPASKSHDTSDTPKNPEHFVNASFILFKHLFSFRPNTAFLYGYEVFKGDVNQHLESVSSNNLMSELLTFIIASQTSPMLTLTPAEFEKYQKIRPKHNVHQYWIVDYFAPWCPPCMRMMPEIRALGSNLMTQIAKADPSFKTYIAIVSIDCSDHLEYCKAMGITSYPSLRFYNLSQYNSVGNKPLETLHKIEGFQASPAIEEWVEDIMNPPPLVNLNGELHERYLTEDSGHYIWFIYYGAQWCGPCLQFEPTWKKFAKSMQKLAYIGKIDCGLEKEFCRSIDVRSFPRIRVYVNKTTFYDYPDSWWRDLASIKAWAMRHIPSNVVSFNDQPTIVKEVIEPFKQKTLIKPWIIDYYANWCSHCVQFAPEFEELNKRVAQFINMGKIDCAVHGVFCQNQSIRHYPTVRLYTNEAMVELDTITADEIEDTLYNNYPHFFQIAQPGESERPFQANLKDEL